MPQRGALRHRLGIDGRGALVLRDALEYAKTRVQFDRPIAGFQITQEKLATCWSS